MELNIFKDLNQFELKLGLPSGFYDKLLKEDDWSFVIKLNALFEAASTHVLVTRLRVPDLEDSFSHLDFAQNKSGKISFLRAAKVLTNEQATILKCLAELRNTLVHNVTNVQFCFAEYVGRLDKNQRKTLVNRYGHGVSDSIQIGDLHIQRDKFVTQNPKLALWMTSAEILACMHQDLELADIIHQREIFNGYAKTFLLESDASQFGK